MAHQESCSMFFLPESAFPAKKIPPNFTAYDGRELGHACLKYTLAEKVYLNPLFKTCTSFIAWISSTTQAGKHFCSSVLQLVNAGRETLLICQINTEIHLADMASLVNFSAPRPLQAPGEVFEEMWYCHWGWEEEISLVVSPSFAR